MFNIFKIKPTFSMNQLNNKQKTIVLLIIILLLLNKINIKKNGMNQEGGRFEETEEIQKKHDEKIFFDNLWTFTGWNPLNWGWFVIIPILMICYLIGAYILLDYIGIDNSKVISDFNFGKDNIDNSKVMPTYDLGKDNMETIYTDIQQSKNSILNAFNNLSPSQIKTD